MSITNVRTYLFFTLALIFTLSVFQFTPLEKVFFQLQAGFIVVLFLFTATLIVDRLIRGSHIKPAIKYIIFLAFGLPLYSATQAYIQFDQPLYLGILTERGWLIITVSLWIYYSITTNKLDLYSIKKCFLYFSFISLIVFILFRLFYDPSQLGEENHLAKLTADRGIRFKFQYYFITFGLIYFFISLTKKSSLKNFLIFISYLGFMLFVIQGRTYFLTIAAIFALYSYFNLSRGRLTMFIYKASIFIFLSVLLLSIFNPTYLQTMLYLFEAMFEVLGGDVSSNASANARIFTLEKIFTHWNEHQWSLLFGSGKLSNYYYDGYETFFGYFYPSDVGIMGGLYIYGIIGSIFTYLIPLIYSAILLKNFGNEEDIFLTSLKYLSIFFLITPNQGALYFQSQEFIIGLIILYTVKEQQLQES